MAGTRHSLGRRALWPLVAGMAMLLTVGCARWNWRGRGFEDDEDAAWTQKLRPPADSRKFSGLDARSQEIERNLGVR